MVSFAQRSNRFSSLGTPAHRWRQYRRAITCAILAVFFGISVREVRADIFFNGELETFVNGIPQNWTYTQGDGAPSIQSLEKSPFGSGTSSVLLVDGSNSSGPFLETDSLIADPYAFSINFDFRLDELTGNPWEISYRGTVFTIDGPGHLLKANGLDILTLEAGVWYQVRSVNAIYKQPILGFGVDVLAQNAANPVHNGRIEPAFWAGSGGTVLISDISGQDGIGAGKNGNLFIDNVSAQIHSISIPEPSSALMTLGGATFLMVRRRRTKAAASRSLSPVGGIFT